MSLTCIPATAAAAGTDVGRHHRLEAPGDGLVARHAGVLPILQVVHVEAAGGGEAAPAVQVGDPRRVVVQLLRVQLPLSATTGKEACFLLLFFTRVTKTAVPSLLMHHAQPLGACPCSSGAACAARTCSSLFRASMAGVSTLGQVVRLDPPSQ